MGRPLVNDMTEGKLSSQIIRFSIPLVLANLCQMVYNLADMLVVGRLVGVSGVSAVSIGGNVLHLCTIVCMGLSSGGQVLIGQYVGSGNKEKLVSFIGTVFAFILGLALVLTCVLVALADPILHLLETPAEALSQARDYILVCFLGLFFIYGYNIVSSVLRGMGDSKNPLRFIAIAIVLNLILDVLFIGPMKMGVFGAALATVISQAISFLLALNFLFRSPKTSDLGLSIRHFKIQLEHLTALLRLGIPMTLQLAAISISTTFVHARINAYGVIASATTGVGGKLNSISGLATRSLGTAATSVIAQNFAAGKIDRVKRTVHISLAFLLAVAGVISACFLLFPAQIFGIFSQDPEVLDLAAIYMRICVISCTASALMTPFNALINGIGNASLSLVIGILDGVVTRVLLAILFGEILNYGLYGYWLGNALAGFTTVILAMTYYFWGRWTKREPAVSK